MGALGRRLRDRRVLAVLLASLATASALGRAIAEFGIVYTDDDQTIFWYAASAFARLAFHEPCFYGQAYNTLFEGLVAAPAVALGLSVHLAVPIAASLVAVAPWCFLSLLALKRKQPVLAVLAAGAPLFFPARYLLILTMARGFHTGLAFSALGLLLSLWSDRPGGRRLLLGAFFLGFGVMATPNAGLLAAPVLFYLGLRHLRQLRLLVALLSGFGLSLGLWQLAVAFYVAHPAYDLYPLGSLQWRPDLLSSVLRDPDLFLGELTPVFGRFSFLWLLPPLILGFLARRARSHALLATVIFALVVTVASFGFAKVHQGGESIYYPRQRMFLALPPLVVWLALETLAVLRRPPGLEGWRARWGRWGLPAALVAVIGMAGITHLRLSPQIPPIADQNSRLVVHRKVEPLLARCERYARAAREQGVSQIVFLESRSAAYACGGVLAGEVETLVPDYERRTWLLLAANSTVEERLLLADAGEDTCPRAWRAGLGCQVLGDDLVEVEPRGQVTLQVVRAVGGRVRSLQGRRR